MMNILAPVALRSRREALGLSRSDFAKMLGIGESAIRSWEIAKSSPRDPSGIDQLLGQLESEFLNLVDALTCCTDDSGRIVGEPLLLRSYINQREYEVNEPYWSSILPISTYRVAVAHSAMILNSRNIAARIVGVSERDKNGQWKTIIENSNGIE